MQIAFLTPRPATRPQIPGGAIVCGRWPGEFLPGCRGYDIRPARTPHQQRAAASLVRRMYSWRGYSTESPGRRTDEAHRITLAAWQDDEVVATLTVGRDSPAGLLGDALYSEEIDRLRRGERVICEVSRLAVDPDFSSRDLLTTLFRVAHRYAQSAFGATDAVIEVNPRHARYYERQFGFRRLGGVKQCPRVDAPAVLLHQRLDALAIPDLATDWAECSNDLMFFPPSSVFDEH